MAERSRAERIVWGTVLRIFVLVAAAVFSFFSVQGDFLFVNPFFSVAEIIGYPIPTVAPLGVLVAIIFTGFDLWLFLISVVLSMFGKKVDYILLGLALTVSLILHFGVPTAYIGLPVLMLIGIAIGRGIAHGRKMWQRI